MKNIKKLFTALVMVIAMTATITGCGGNTEEPAEENTAAETTEEINEEEPESITITTFNGEKEEIELEVPYNPGRVAVMDLAVLDMLDNFGFGDRVVGVSKGSSIDYLQKYIDNDDIINLGTIKEASMEAVMESEPEIIFIGGRLSSVYDELSEIAPVVFLATDVEIGVVESTKQNAVTIASIFGAEDQVDTLFSDFDTRIKALQEAAADQTAFVGMLNAGAFNALGNDGRCSLIGVEVGFENIGIEAVTERGGGGGRGESSEGEGATSTHGNETSFEFIVEKAPDYIFVMNRDDAIGTEGAETAQEVIENELVIKTSAYENGNIVYLEHSNVWYTAEGGITALDYMLKDLESALLD